jgi:hypothetical protein
MQLVPANTAGLIAQRAQPGEVPDQELGSTEWLENTPDTTQRGERSAAVASATGILYITEKEFIVQGLAVTVSDACQMRTSAARLARSSTTPVK